MKKNNHQTRRKRTTRVGALAGAAFVGVLMVGTIRNPNFWRTTAQRGDALMRARKFHEAAHVYTDPWQIGLAQYRDGDFKTAAKTFARVPGADGAFNMANAQFMHGQYDAAMAAYDRALSFRPGWKEAEENKALALARKTLIEGSGKDRAQESADAYEADQIVFDLKGSDKKSEPVDLASENPATDEGLQAMWLRRVQTTPGDFLRAKFAYQASRAAAPDPNAAKEAKP